MQNIIGDWYLNLKNGLKRGIYDLKKYLNKLTRICNLEKEGYGKHWKEIKIY